MEDIGIAIIFFNRPDSFKKVLEAVSKVKPSKLFLIQDGARSEKDIINVNKCRELISIIDWNCQIFKNFSENNLGCGRRMSSGISWVFDYVEKAIILEDDCVPSTDFFFFCIENLNKYENDKRILMISGMNHFGETPGVKEDYFFAINGAIWGWATWKRAWKLFDYSASAIEDKEIVDFLLTSGIEPRHVAKADVKQWKTTNQKVKNGEKMSYWAHQWRLSKMINHNLCIIPKYNLVTNVGDIDPTHPASKGEICKFHNMETVKIHFPISHPKYVHQYLPYDDMYYRDFYPTKLQRILKRIQRTVKNVNK